MTQTFTTTESWSRTHARYVAGKVAADLLGMQQAYGLPSDAAIESYMAELTELLAGGYVSEVSYGFKRSDKIVVALKYSADMNGNLTTDDRSGKIPLDADVSGATSFSFLTFSSKWNSLTENDRQSIEKCLPFIRTAGSEPMGLWSYDKTYSSAGCGVRRATAGGSA
jgi:hypothetical protein